MPPTALRVLAGPPVLRVGAFPTVYTTSVVDGKEPQKREREGRAAFTTMATGAFPFVYAEGQRLLSNAELWQAYKLCPDVRSSIEGIVRVVSTWDWSVEPTLDASDPRYERAQQAAADAKRFLDAPNTDGETWQILCSKLVRDLMVFDAMAGEHVMDAKGRLQEIVALRGGDIVPVVDSRQRLLEYRQQSPTGQVFFAPEQLLYLNLFPNTTAPGGLPLIEAIVTEIVTLMRQSKHLMLAVDADEIPPGILVLAGIAGKAAERAVEGIRMMRGQDQRLRVLTSNNPGGLTAQWIELRHTLKDLALKDVIKEVQRTVWRIFGVKPVSQGDTEATPRATAEVQVDMEESGLIQPILEAIETAINARTMPLVLGDPELATMVRFGFDVKKKLSAQEEQAEGSRDIADMEHGVITVNERRKIRGMAPFGPEGDVPMVRTSNGYERLLDVTAEPVAGPEEVEPGTEKPGAAPEDGEGGGVEEPETSEPTEQGPGEAEAEGKGRRPREPRRVQPGAFADLRSPGHAALESRQRAAWTLRPVHHSRHEPCSCYAHRSGLLPSDWQPAGKFKGYRVLNLQRLGSALTTYAKEVQPLYRRARMDVTSSVRSYLGDGKIDNQELIPLMGRIQTDLEKLAANWRDTTEPMYRAAARVGRDAAVHWTGAQVAADWEAKGEEYHRKAMGYLVADRGLVSDLQAELRDLIVAAVRSMPAARAQGEDDPLALVDGLDTAAILGAVRKVFDSNQYRIENWSGKLVELANQVFAQGMADGPPSEDPEDEGDGVKPAKPSEPGGPDEPAEPSKATSARSGWYFEWVSVDDESRCDTCIFETQQGFRPIEDMRIQPASGTLCGGRCRCVLVFWTKQEVKDGKAVSLNGEVRWVRVTQLRQRHRSRVPALA